MICCVLFALVLMLGVASSRAIRSQLGFTTPPPVASRPGQNRNALRAGEGGWTRRRLMSFRFAASGLVYVLRTQTNAQIHTFAATLAIGAGFQFSFEPWAWALLALAIAFVLFAEVMNTAIEYLCDVVCPERSKAVQRAKDIAAGAVLISATCAVSVGLIVLHATSAAELVSPGDLCLYE